MTFDPNLKPGDVIDNDRLTSIFGCGPQGGMRRSLKTNTLVIVSNHVKSIYDDRWIGDVFHYTGMGMAGDQSLDFMQNRTLAESPKTGVEVHLFEVHRPKEYQYQGRVVLAAPPYQESQSDADRQLRNVWVFPLRKLDGSPALVEKQEFEAAQQLRLRKAASLSPEELAARALTARPLPGQRAVVSKEFERDPAVSAYAKHRARGICQLCQQPAPFQNTLGEPYLETHHIEWLAKGGTDTVENTVALCPNCHRRMHVLNDAADIARLKQAAG